jgi:rhodanese-related sulfurtransferase
MRSLIRHLTRHLAALLFALPLLLTAQAVRAEIIDIDHATLNQLRQKGVPVIDIRLQSEWEQTGIVPGSHLLTFFDERGRYDAPAWLAKVHKIAKPNEAVIVICRTGNRTRPVSQLLSQQAGYTTVYNVKSGIKDWIAQGGTPAPAAPVIATCKAEQRC